MLGSIIGDIIGSRFEINPITSKSFNLFDNACRFTDDTVLTIAIADALLAKKDYKAKVLDYGLKYHNKGYGPGFIRWVDSKGKTQGHSYGNGSAMRIAAVGFYFETKEKVVEQAKKAVEMTHNHPEGIKGAQAIAFAIFLARNGYSKEEIKFEISNKFEYKFEQSISEIKENYTFSIICQDTVPQALTCFFESTDYEDAIRNAVSLGGDADTLACIAGGVSEAFYGGVPLSIKTQARTFLPSEFLTVIDKFTSIIETRDLQKNKLLASAISLAEKHHKGQTDKGGAPYINHVKRVMESGKTTDEKIVGVLHDIVEDTNITYEDLEDKGFPARIVEAIWYVTKTEDDYMLFIDRVKRNDLATRVKLNDLADNLDVKRLSNIEKADTHRLNKYLKAFKMLTEVK